jgi:ribonuclease P protein component
MKVKYRVKTHEDFQEVIKEKKTVSNRIYVLYYKKNELNHSRVGISSSKKLGNAVVFSSHNLDVVEKICDRLIIINNGKIVSDIVISEFKKTSKISLEEFFMEKSK